MAYLLTDNSSYAIKRPDTIHEVQVGDFLSQSLVTDTIIYEVIKTTKSTITLRKCSMGEVVVRDFDRVGDFPIVYTEAVANPDGEVITVRERKLRNGKGGHYTAVKTSRPRWLKVAKQIDGKPVFTTDYSF